MDRELDLTFFSPLREKTLLSICFHLLCLLQLFWHEFHNGMFLLQKQVWRLHVGNSYHPHKFVCDTCLSDHLKGKVPSNFIYFMACTHFCFHIPLYGAWFEARNFLLKFFVPLQCRPKIQKCFPILIILNFRTCFLGFLYHFP